MAAGVTACKTETPLSTTGVGIGTGSSSGTTATPTATPVINGSSTSSFTASVDSVLYLKVERILRTGDGSRTSVGICKIPSGTLPILSGNPAVSTNATAEGAVGSGSAQIICTPTVGGDFSIPEGELYLSTLVFTAGTNDSSQCSQVIFRPYYYLASVTSYVSGDAVKVGFTTPWLTAIPTTPIDCTAGKAVAGCFNGPAVSIVPNFPSNNAVFFLTESQALEAEFSVKSAYDFGQTSNRFTMNNKADWTALYKDAGFPFGSNDYVGDTAAVAAGYSATSDHTVGFGAAHQDYAVECRNQWADTLYTIHVVMNDENSSGGSVVGGDQYHTWP